MLRVVLFLYIQGDPSFREQLTKTATPLSLLALSNGSQANTVVCRGTVHDLKLVLVTLAAAAAVEAAQSKLTII